MSHLVQEEKAAAVTFVPGKGIKEETDDDKTVPLFEDEQTTDNDHDTTTPLLQPKKKIDIYNSVAPEHQPLVHEAGQGGMVVGLLVGGPLGCALVGFGAAYAVRKPDGLGKAARSLGKATLSAKTKLGQVEQDHQYGHRASRAIKKITPTCAQTWSRTSWHAATNFTHDHQLLERGVEGTGRGIEYLSRNLSRIQHRRHHHPAPTTTTPAVGNTTTAPYLCPGDEVASPPQGQAGWGWSPTECHRGYQPPTTTNEYTKLCAVEATAE